MKELPVPICASRTYSPVVHKVYSYSEASNSELRRLAQIGLEAEANCHAKPKPDGTEWRSLETWELDPGSVDEVRRVASMRELDIAVSRLRWEIGKLSCELHRHVGE